jgi:uncharacterized protein YxjI
MRYVMKQKWLSFGDDFSVFTPDNREAFFIDGRALSFGDKLSMHAGGRGGPEVAFISQKLLSWGPTYEIHREGRLYAVVKKELFTFFHCRFNVDVPGPNDYQAEGDFLEHEYTFTRVGVNGPVAHVSKRFFAWTDTYGIDIADGEDDVTLLASAIVIDLCCHNDKRRH